MITLKNVNKYFFRHKKNEIHVINDTTLVFQDTGLVALLGPSGCGKTTLLNAIGGLDKINSGSIFINDKKMPKGNTNLKDKLRVLNIGYIFQNYNLLDNLTVYENVALSLKMVGIRDKKEIKKRVDYILEKVGMYRFRNKPAGMLSGGQRQRVGIARAIVKNPDVIIADEPTGNLDSKNTIEIMNIIKAISKNKLVILVTHEKDLAHFYASRIISLEDGRVIDDRANEHENELDYRIDNKIYLKDFKNTKEVSDESRKVRFFYDKDEDVSLDIVIKNGNIYIKTNDTHKIEVVDDNSGIEFIDDYYKKISRDDYENSSFDIQMLDNSKQKLRYTSIYNLFSMFKAGLKKVASYTFMKKILLVGFFISSMFIVYSISIMAGALNIKDESFVRVHKEYIEIENNKNNLNDYQKIEKLEGIKYVIPGSSLVNIKIKNEEFFQLKDARIQGDASLMSSELLTKEDMVSGEVPKNSNEIVIDKSVLTSLRKNNPEMGILNFKGDDSFIGFDTQVGDKDISMKIVGISDTGSPCVYAFVDNFINMVSKTGTNPDNVTTDIAIGGTASGVSNYNIKKDEITIKEGRAPENDYEVIVNIDNKYSMPLDKTIDMKVNEQKLKVVGYYYSKTGIDDYFVSENTYKYDIILNNKNMMILAKDKTAMVQNLKDMGYNAKDTYENARNEYISNAKSATMESLIVSGILLAISFVEIFLMIRASFLSRIKEVGIYRAIGVKRGDIYKMFMGEILIITTLAGMPGVVFMSMLLKEISKVPYFTTVFVVNYRVVAVCIVLIYALNLLVGLLPIRQTISKSPAEILSRNDVD